MLLTNTGKRLKKVQVNWRQCLREIGQLSGSCPAGNRTSLFPGWETRGDLLVRCECMHETWNHVLYSRPHTGAHIHKSKNRTAVISAVRIFEISNRIVTSVFDSIRNENNYSKFSNTYCHQFLTYLTEWRRFFTFAKTPSSQQNLLSTIVQVLYLLEVFILAHYGPLSTETPTTETRIVQCHKNSWIYLKSTYYWWLLRPTITIRFNSKLQIIAEIFDLIWFKMKKNTIRTALVVMCICPSPIMSC